jgi:hypothetical protein
MQLNHGWTPMDTDKEKGKTRIAPNATNLTEGNKANEGMTESRDIIFQRISAG